MIKANPVFLCLGIIALLIVAGCVAPPKDTAGSSGSSKGSTQPAAAASSTTTATPANVYITEATPYITQKAAVTPTSGYSTFATQTPLPEDRSCRIYTYSTPQDSLLNQTAFAFNLKNPPMYINYTVVPQNITVNKIGTSRYGTKEDQVYQFSTYDPQAYFIVTVRSKATGEIYLEDGFGTDYTTYLTRTLKVLDTDDMLIEIKSNKVAATANFWVKPYGNFDNPANMTFDACTYWGQTRDNTAYAYVTSTTTPTWTPGNVISE